MFLKTTSQTLVIEQAYFSWYCICLVTSYTILKYMLYNVVIEHNPFNLKLNGIGRFLRNHRKTKVTHLSNIIYNKVSICQVNIAKASSVYCSAIFSSQDKYHLHHTHKLPER